MRVPFTNRGAQRAPLAAWFVTLALCAIVLSCGDSSGDDASSEPRCLEAIDAQCTTAYEPTWDNVYNFTLTRSCAAAGVSCHGRDGMQGGLGLFSRDVAYEALVGGEGGSAPRVIPGDAACSPLLERLATTDMKRRMPLSSAPLSAGQVCAVQQWIAAGASR
jgi:Planctomycete cytochrome C